MPSISKEFTVELGRKGLWSSLTDLPKLAKCIPGYESASIVNESEFTWIGKIKIGVVSRRINATVRITKRVEQKEIVFVIESVDGDLTGEFSVVLLGGEETLSPPVKKTEPANSTRIKLDAVLEAQGSFQWLIERIIDSQIDSFANGFASCIASEQ